MGLGQPGWIPSLSPVAAACGYALFWRAFLIFPKRLSRFLAATLWFSLVQGIQLSWMSSTEYQGPFILVVYAFLAVALGIQFGLLSLLIPSDRPLPFKRCITLAALWTFFEWSRTHILCGFTFNPTGLALAGYTVPLQCAALFGILGLSFWVMLTNSLALNALKSMPKQNYFVWGAFALTPYLFGLLHLALHQGPASRAPALCVALVQTGLLPEQKVPLYGRFEAFLSPYEQWRRLLSLLPKAKIDLIAFPEAALPFYIDTPIFTLEEAKKLFEPLFDAPVYAPLTFPYAATVNAQTLVTHAFMMQTLANTFGADVVTGLDGQDRAKGEVYNAAYHFSPHAYPGTPYIKRKLMPIAEYLPYEWARPLARAFGVTNFFEPGKTSTLFYGKVPMAASICYDETFPHLIRQARRSGAALLVNVTNDNWYPRSRLPKQHFDLGRLRSVESGAPSLRACNSGITAGMDSLGRIVAKVGQGGASDWEAGSALFKISTYHYHTPFTVWGNAGIAGLILFFYGLCRLFQLREEKGLAQNQ